MIDVYASISLRRSQTLRYSIAQIRHLTKGLFALNLLCSFAFKVLWWDFRVEFFVLFHFTIVNLQSTVMLTNFNDKFSWLLRLRVVILPKIFIYKIKNTSSFSERKSRSPNFDVIVGGDFLCSLSYKPSYLTSMNDEERA